MKVLTPVTALLAALPVAAHAQIDIKLPTISIPTAEASVGPWSVSATLGANGVDVRVGDRRVAVGSTERAPSSSRRPASTTGAAARATASGVLATADEYVGTRYVYGGTSPRGFDCSGFVQYVFRRHGVELPRTSRQQAAVGTSIAATVTALRPGDLMLFASNGSRIDHVAIYAGGNRILHSSASGGGVGYDNLSTQRGQWFVDHHVATRRVLANGRSLVADLDAVARLFAGLDPPDHAPHR